MFGSITMVAAFSATWARAEPFMHGLKLGGLMNESVHNEDAFRQGRHHVMTALTQILQWSLAIEQISRCLKAANIGYSVTYLTIASYVVPVGVTYLASRQIKVLHISQIANFVQRHLGDLSLLATAVATVALFVLGQSVLAATTLIYLTVGVLDRYNILPESAQKVTRHVNFLVGNFAGLYFGGKFVRLICVLNLVIASVEQYFKYRKRTEGIQKQDAPLVAEEEKVGDKQEVSWEELKALKHDAACSFRLDHIHRKIYPPIREGVQLDDILTLSDELDWSHHEHAIKAHLAHDKRWLEVGRFEATPIEYLTRNIHSLVESIKNRKILQGKPQNYEMLQRYLLYIAQELPNQDEMTQADLLIWLGIEGGEYCGSGKFQVVEEVYENLISQAEGLPLEVRVLACLQQERQQVWQRIYELIWKTNPIWQFMGYMTDIHAVHNANVFINFTQAGDRFGIPTQAAQNDQTAVINPVTQYLAISFVHIIEKGFWEGKSIPQFYVIFKKPEERKDQWKAWKWVKLETRSVCPKPYNEQAALERLNITIGTAQIPKLDIYAWWQEWIMRQEDLSDEQKEKWMDEFSQSASLNGEPLEMGGKIQPKFLKAMLIEMGVFDKSKVDFEDEDHLLAEKLDDLD